MNELRDALNELVGRVRAMDERHQAWIRAQEIDRAKIAGIKPMRLNKIIGTGSATLVMGGDKDPKHSPPEGFVWAVRELVVEGMTGGGTPDIINIWRQGVAAQTGNGFWQLNGNVFFQTWGYGEKLLFPGEALLYTAGATFNSTAQIIAHGIAESVPGEMIGKLFD